MKNVILTQLKALPFMAGMPDAQLWRFAQSLEMHSFATDDVFFQEGDERSMFALVVTGGVAIEKTAGGRTTRLVTMGPGEAIGEGILLDDTRHGTTARAVIAGELLILRKDKLADIVKDNPHLYAGLVNRAARAIAGRLRIADATLVGRGRTLGFGSRRMRKEHDLLGEREVPDEALYGVQTLRAAENFPITGVPLREFPELINALAAVKIAAAQANRGLGLLTDHVADAIVRAGEEIRAGRHHEHFIVDMIQGGAGTSTNMNANEVIANRALEILGRSRGTYDVVHPNEHVNRSQSTNDVYPTAIRIALHTALDGLRDALRDLCGAMDVKAVEFRELIKMGRTQLQDAVPMTLGREFKAWAHTLMEDVDRLGEAQALMREMNMGATAIGTGITASEEFTVAVRTHLSEVTGLMMITAPDLIEATSDTGAFVQLSGVLKRTATKLSKICNDLRLLSSGPRAGFGEINLPPMQPGSSIMPGKVNPVIPEVVNQVCFNIIGGDVTVTMAAEAGQLQLNVFEPIIAYKLLGGIHELTQAIRVLQEKCIVGITANAERMRFYVEHSIGVVTALLPVIGYEKATVVAKEALASGRGVTDIVLERGWMTRAQLDEVLSPEAMAGRLATTFSGMTAGTQEYRVVKQDVVPPV
jgi:aspartate ammonia-lyase